MKVLVLNAHSPQNAGDLAILQETIACLRVSYPACDITVAINDPHDTLLPPEARYVPSLTRWLVALGNDGTWRWNKPIAPFAALWLLVAALLFRFVRVQLMPRRAPRRLLMRAYYQADLVAVIGGGHLYAPHRFNIAFLWLWVGLACAIVMGKPLVLLPQSFGPLPGRFQRGLLRWLLNRSALVVTREYRSLRLLAKIKVRRRVLAMPDLAFSTHEASPAALDAVVPELRMLRKDDRPVIGLTLMDWGGQNARFSGQASYEQAIIALITHVSSTYSARVVLFAQCTGPTPDQDDRRVARRIAAALPQYELFLVDRALPPNLLKAAYRQLDVLVATRMHSAIFGLSACVPTLVIGYLHKSVGIMEQLGLRQFTIDIGEAEAARCCVVFDQLWNERQSVRARLADRIPAMQHTLAHLPRLVLESTPQHSSYAAAGPVALASIPTQDPA